MTLSKKSHENTQYFPQQTVSNVIYDIINNINVLLTTLLTLLMILTTLTALILGRS